MVRLSGIFQTSENTDFIRNQQLNIVNSILQKKVTKKQKRLIISLLVIFFLLYKLLYRSQLKADGACIRDFSHSLTQSLNQKINEGGDFYYWIMIIGQIFIDFNFLMFALFQLFKVRNFLIFAWVGVFYGVRGLFLNVQKLPYPEGIYWQAPGFPPSIGVPYGITRDFFYSGHTGMMLFCCLFWGLKKQTKILKYIAIIGLFYIMVLVVSTRVHYIIDVYAGLFFCIAAFQICKANLTPIDKFFSRGYQVFIYCCDYFKRICFNQIKTPTDECTKTSQNYIEV